MIIYCSQHLELKAHPVSIEDVCHCLSNQLLALKPQPVRHVTIRDSDGCNRDILPTIALYRQKRAPF